jgi:hypothetical protein
MSRFYASLLTVVLVVSLLVSPSVAQGNGNAMCNPYIPDCGCNLVRKNGKCTYGKNTFKCPVGICKDVVPQGVVFGVCIGPNVCEGVEFSSHENEAMKTVKSTLSTIGAIGGVGGLVLQVAAMFKGQPTGNTNDYGAGSSCTQYYPVSEPSSDPCAYYTPPTSDLLLGDLGGGPTTGDLFGDLEDNLVSDYLSDNLTPVSDLLDLNGTLELAGGEEAVVEPQTSSFSGREEGSPGLIARLCERRPWATGFISSLLSASYFDSLCADRGYSFGATPVQGFTAPPPTTTHSTTTAKMPTAEIWASPERVAVGGRTSIFWRSSEVSSCLVTSSDGHFNETALWGGAATAPITTPTTFSIRCTTGDGRQIDNSVVVRIAL